MSIDIMTDRAINARFSEPRVIFTPAERAPHFETARRHDFSLYDKANQLTPAPVESDVVSTDSSRAASALSAIVAYIPTEVVTTYVAVLVALGTMDSHSSLERWVTFWIFVGFAPLATWVLFAVKLKAHRGTKAQKGLAFKKWPWWSLFAATLAFAVWRTLCQHRRFRCSLGTNPHLVLRAYYLSLSC